MNKSVKKHLDGINDLDFLEFVSDKIITYAHANVNGLNAVLGANCFGKFVVNKNKESFSFDNPNDAIEKYKEILTNEEKPLPNPILPNPPCHDNNVGGGVNN